MEKLKCIKYMKCMKCKSVERETTNVRIHLVMIDIVYNINLCMDCQNVLEAKLDDFME